MQGRYSMFMLFSFSFIEFMGTLLVKIGKAKLLQPYVDTPVTYNVNKQKYEKPTSA